MRDALSEKMIGARAYPCWPSEGACFCAPLHVFVLGNVALGSEIPADQTRVRNESGEEARSE